MTLYGKCLTVETRDLGEPALGDHAVGATVLAVQDAATFDEVGGFVTINGEQITYLGIDVDADTLTLAIPLTTAVTDQDFVAVYPATPVKTALVDMLDNSDPVPATVPHNLLDRLQDGVREPDAQETLQLDRRGVYEYVVADVTAEQLVQTSLDYSTAEQGNALTEAGAQLGALNVLGSMVASDIAAENINLGGADLITWLNSQPRGVIKAASKYGTTAKNAGPVTTTELRLFTFAVGQVYADRYYRFSIQGHIQTDIFPVGWTLTVRYTLDGTEPTTTSPVIGSHRKVLPTANDDFSYFDQWVPPSDGTLTLALTMIRSGAGGTGQLYQGSSAYQFHWIAEDRGLAANYDPAALSQKLYMDGSGSDNPALATFTKTFNAVWGSGIDDGGSPNDNTYYTGSGPYGTVGTDAFGNTNTFAMCGFDTAAIAAALTGVVTPTSLKLRWRCRTRKVSTGLDVRFLTHTYSSLAAWNATNPTFVNYSSLSSTVFYTGASRLNAVNGTLYDNELGTTIFGQFRLQQRRGIGFANHVSGNDGTGSVWLDGTYQPQLLFTYQGTS